jgi:hypothetical protein
MNDFNQTLMIVAAAILTALSLYGLYQLLKDGTV